MIGDGNRKRNLWALAIAIGICVAAMLLDGAGVAIDPALSGLLLIVAAVLMVVYVVSNYTGGRKE